MGGSVGLRARAGLLVLVSLALLAAPVPGEASHGAGCGGGWSSSETCPFDFRGFPIIIRGDAEASSSARVRVWITEARRHEAVPLECTDSGGGFASCDGEIGVGEELDLLLPLWTLLCHVEGRSSGEYWCQSGRGF